MLVIGHQVKGDYLAENVDLAFECTIIARLVDTDYDAATLAMRKHQGGSVPMVTTTTMAPTTQGFDKDGRKWIYPEVTYKGGVLVECSKFNTVGSNGVKNPCSLFIEINRGHRK